MAPPCGGCASGLSSAYRRLRRWSQGHGGPAADCSPRRDADGCNGYHRQEDQVPTYLRPRVGCWASPVPYSPTGFGTWQRQVSDASDDSKTPVQVLDVPDNMEFDLKVLEGAAAHVQAQKMSADAIVGASTRTSAQERRRRLREIDLAVRRLQAAPVKQKDGKDVRRSFGTEQLLASPGSLPKVPTAAQRQAAQRELMARLVRELPAGVGPVLERISKVPRRLLTARGPDGQNLRREMLRGAVIVFFTAGYEGKRFIFERAHQLGVRTVLIENADSWSRRLEDEGIISKFVPVDMSQSSGAVYIDALAAIEALADDPMIGPADGIATFVELSVPTAARLAEALGLPGPLPECVDVARDKYQTRAALAAAGLPTPPNHLIRCEADLGAAAAKVGFPAVLKPISGAASLGVKKVVDDADLVATYHELDRELRTLVVSSGALVKATPQNPGTNAVGVIGASFLLERYLDGAEVDVDVVMSEGEWCFAAVSDNGPTLEPYFNETWAVTPSLLPRDQQVALKDLAIGSVKALGFLDGVFHVECKYTSFGPQLIEVNARMGGGPVYETHRRCWNCCLVEETLFAATGVPSRPDVPREPLECVANSDVNTLRSGRLQDLSFLEPLRDRQGVVHFIPHVEVGEEVVGPQDGLPTWLVEVVVSQPTPRQALDFLLQLEAEIQSRVRLAPPAGR
uniref:ATP-grasp domain-containing protein n=1 Tax=Zooxanthella nutricula TaxID=1333877 RepID=A0A6V0DDE4_9DINO